MSKECSSQMSKAGTGLCPLSHLANIVTDMMNVVIVSVIVITEIIMTIQWIRLHSPAYFTA